ncbi:hypothetical protein KNO15_13620 [Leifsonia shinshuensis]|uniref:hypothetical protein n=1 Tax=Leifsonia shinshuensis TaxID=150026 RepID=UPI001F5052B7|nr:hypothetical protein [Leifsonia shinshuensis]MCI0157734.1 hypothetical protein [Leifsonia shinshuensis]
MTTTHSLPTAGMPLLLKTAAVATWHELPRVVALGLLSLVAAVPLVLSLLFAAPPWISGAASAPLALLATGLSAYAAAIARGEKPTLRDGLRLDPVLGLSLGVAATLLAEGIALGGGVAITATVLAAAVLVLAPYALAYAAVRGRRGLTAWRGAAILVAFRPGAALTVLALCCIGGFAVVASAGTLAVVLPCILSVFTCSVVGDELETIDGMSR